MISSLFALLLMTPAAEPIEFKWHPKNLVFKQTLPDILLQPQQMEDDQRRLGSQGIFLLQSGKLSLAQRGGWSPQLPAEQLELLHDLTRLTHVKVFASPPIG